jgi:hypothetical protein
VPPPSPYALEKVGHCQAQSLFITSETECQQAATALGITRTVGSAADKVLPKGCYFRNDPTGTALWFNSDGIYTSYDTGRVSICHVPQGDIATDTYGPNVEDVGEYNGGLCTCPNGLQYEVGDRKNNCGSLACIGGTSGQCSIQGLTATSKYMQVRCAAGAPTPPTPAPTPEPTAPPPPPAPTPQTCVADSEAGDYWRLIGSGYDITKAGTSAAIKTQFMDSGLSDEHDVTIIANPATNLDDKSEMGDSLSKTAGRISTSLGIDLAAAGVPLFSFGLSWLRDQHTAISAKKQFTSSFYKSIINQVQFNPRHSLQLSDEAIKPAIVELFRGTQEGGPRWTTPSTLGVNDKQRYFDFFELYGTHVIRSAGFGGWLSMQSTTTTFECTSRNYNCFAAASSVHFKRKSGLEANAFIDHSDCTENDYSNIERASDTKWKCLGGSAATCAAVQMHGASAVPAWRESVKCNMYPVEVNLEPIGNYVAEAFSKASIESLCPTRAQFKAMLTEDLSQDKVRVTDDDSASDFAHRCIVAAKKGNTGSALKPGFIVWLSMALTVMTAVFALRN